jgi:archaellum component FlaC
MARNIDNEFLGRLKNYIKKEWLKNGQQPFSKVITEIAQDLFGEEYTPKHASDLGNKTWRYLRMLEQGLSIKIEKGKSRGNPNWYTWLNENINEQLFQQKEERISTIDNIANEGTDFVRKIINTYENQSKQYLNILGELNHLKESIKDLELFSVGTDGRQILMAKKGSNINSIIDQVKQEFKHEYQ